MTECRPPEGTSDGTVCWMLLPAHGGLNDIYEPMQWGRSARHYWRRLGSDAEWLPQELADWGWRFHSIATPPEQNP